jgi:hypothetical protein
MLQLNSAIQTIIQELKTLTMCAFSSISAATPQEANEGVQPTTPTTPSHL